MADFKTPISTTVAGKLHDESSSAMEIDGSEEDRILSKSQYLTREEVIKRRLRKCKQLDRCYRDHYWALMEDLKVQYRKYVWIHGRSPYREDEERDDADGSAAAGAAENHLSNSNNGGNKNISTGNNVGSRERAKCQMSGCKTSAMELTRFCYQHILADQKQTLYMSCTFVFKSASHGPLFCGKPVLKATFPSFCPGHLQKAEEQLAKALRKQGLKASDTPRAPPKLHVIVAEYVRQIQMKRRAAKKKSANKVQVKENVQIKDEHMA